MKITEKLIKKYTDKIIPTVYGELPSTNTTASQLAREGAAEGTAVIARRQTDGRGRLGRQFVGYDGGIYMSVILRPKITANDTLLITTAAAVAVSRAIEKVSGKKCGIKWVNDIYLNGKKVCGILTEGGFSGGSAALDYAVLGIGVNLFAESGGHLGDIAVAGTVFDKARLLKKRTAARLIAETANEFFAFYEDLASKKYIEEYRTRSVLTGKKISYQKGGQTSVATVFGIDDDARLLVKTGEQVTALSTGEVQIISAEGLFEGKYEKRRD